MNPGATSLVAHQSKVKARYYYQRRFYGRAFAHLLIALKLMPEWKVEFKVAFSTTLSYWSQILERQKRYKDLFKCYEQAIEIFPENEEVYYQLAGHLFRSQYLLEAARYYRLALQHNANHLPSYHCLQSVNSSLVPRWHFRMLNDSHRNEAYREAIMKKIRQGFTSVLDIGTGTGILRYIETAWAFSTLLGLVLFLFEIAILCWVKFYDFSKAAAWSACIILIPVLIIFLGFAIHFYRSLVTHKYEVTVSGIRELELLKEQIEAGDANGMALINSGGNTQIV